MTLYYDRLQRDRGYLEALLNHKVLIKFNRKLLLKELANVNVTLSVSLCKLLAFVIFFVNRNCKIQKFFKSLPERTRDSSSGGPLGSESAEVVGRSAETEPF